MTDTLIWLFPLCLALRLTPFMARPRAKAYDTLFHLHLARSIREQRRIPLFLDRAVPAYLLTYPCLFHCLLALFPVRWHGMIERLLPALFDTALLGCVFWLAAMTTPDASLTHTTLLIAGLLFTFHPALLRYDSGPRIHYGSPRVLGQLVYNIHIISLYHFWMTGNIVSFIVSLCAGTGIFFTSKFCIQASLFFGIMLSIFVSLWYSLILCASCVIACLITRGRLLTNLEYDFNNSVRYAKTLQQRFLHPIHSPYISYIKKLKHCILHIHQNPKDLLMHIYWVQRNPLNSLVFLYPEFLLLIGSVITGYIPVWQPLYIIPLAGCLCMFVFETKPMMFLGEGERYMQYAAPTLCVLAAHVMVHMPLFSTGLYCLYGLLFWGVGMAAFWLLTKEGAFDGGALKSFFAQTNALPPGNILPLGHFAWHCLYYSTHPCYVPLAPSKKSDDTHLQMLYDNYPFPSGDLERVLCLFPTSYIVTDVTHLERYKKIMSDPACFNRRCRLLHEVNGMRLYQVLPTD